MGMPAPSKPKRWTAAMVREFPDDGNRYEVIDGVLLVTPAPRLVHQRAVTELLFALRLWSKGQDIGEVLLSPADLELEPDDLVQPDIFVCPLAAKDWTDVRSLVLAVEILSPSTEQSDRGRKRRYFSRVGVPEYWIVDCDERAIECWRPGAATPEVVSTTLEWSPEGATRAFVLDVTAFFRTVNAEG
jgi:Uma2 family endonuclease